MTTKSSTATGGGYDGVYAGRLIAEDGFSLVYETYNLDDDNNTTNNGESHAVVGTSIGFAQQPQQQQRLILIVGWMGKITVWETRSFTRVGGGELGRRRRT